MTKYDYEQVVMCQDEASGLKALIVIHDTTIGPALGGTRFLQLQYRRRGNSRRFKAFKGNDI